MVTLLWRLLGNGTGDDARLDSMACFGRNGMKFKISIGVLSYVVENSTFRGVQHRDAILGIGERVRLRYWE